MSDVLKPPESEPIVAYQDQGDDSERVRVNIDVSDLLAKVFHADAAECPRNCPEK